MSASAARRSARLADSSPTSALSTGSAMKYAFMWPDPRVLAVALILSHASASCLTYPTRAGLRAERLCLLTVLASVLVQLRNLIWLIATCVVTPSGPAVAITLPRPLLDELTGES